MGQRKSFRMKWSKDSFFENMSHQNGHVGVSYALDTLKCIKKDKCHTLAKILTKKPAERTIE